MAKEEKRELDLEKIIVKEEVPIRTFEGDLWRKFKPPNGEPIECPVATWYLLPEMKEKLFSIDFDLKALGLSFKEWQFAEKMGLVELIFKQEVLSAEEMC